MDSDDEQLSGLHLLAYICDQVVQSLIGKEIIYNDETENLDAYPYITYSIVSPETDTTSDWLGSKRQFYITLQFDAHSDDVWQASDYATKLYEALKDRRYRLWFEQAGIEPTNITNSSNRTVLSDINYDNDFGFDCSFLMSAGTQSVKKSSLLFVLEPNLYIKSAAAGNTLTGQSVDTRKKFKEEK